MLAAIIGAAILQFALARVDVHEGRRVQEKTQQSYEELKLSLEAMRKSEEGRLYLTDIKIDALKKYVNEQDLNEFQRLFDEFIEHHERKDADKVATSIHQILQIVPTDPFFLVYRHLLEEHTLPILFSGELKLVQVIRWDWSVTGDEASKLFVSTFDESSNPVRYGPFTNNVISMLDAPVRKYVQIRVGSSGTGHWEYYPNTFKIGWTIAQKQKDGTWLPWIGYAEYEPLARSDPGGRLHW